MSLAGTYTKQDVDMCASGLCKKCGCRCPCTCSCCRRGCCSNWARDCQVRLPLFPLPQRVIHESKEQKSLPKKTATLRGTIRMLPDRENVAGRRGNGKWRSRIRLRRAARMARKTS